MNVKWRQWYWDSFSERDGFYHTESGELVGFVRKWLRTYAVVFNVFSGRFELVHINKLKEGGIID